MEFAGADATSAPGHSGPVGKAVLAFQKTSLNPPGLKMSLRRLVFGHDRVSVFRAVGVDVVNRL